MTKNALLSYLNINVNKQIVMTQYVLTFKSVHVGLKTFNTILIGYKNKEDAMYHTNAL